MCFAAAAACMPLCIRFRVDVSLRVFQREFIWVWGPLREAAAAFAAAAATLEVRAAVRCFSWRKSFI